MRRSFIPFSLLLFLLLVVAACGSDSADLSETEQAIEELRSNFIDQSQLTDEELNQAAIQGIIDYLDDPYTSYLDPDHYQEFSDSLFQSVQEDYEGIGASVQQLDGEIVIVGPMPGSPAAQAGIRPGDVVLEVDGESLKGLTLEEAVNRIRGPQGSTVVLTIRRVGSVIPFDVYVIRDTIELSSVLLAHMLADDIGYVSLANFDANAAEEMREAIAALRDEGAEGLVLDLRDNAGGLLDTAVNVVSEFVATGAVCLGCNPGVEPNRLDVSGEGTALDIPLVVVVNGLSASASEIVAGAIQDHERGVVVGTTTFGKGSVNLLTSLESGAGLYITIARWETPNGRLIEGDGIVPDVVAGESVNVAASQRIARLANSLCVALDEEREDLAGQDSLIDAVEGVCSLSPDDGDGSGRDVQVEAAIAEMRKLLDG